MGMVVGIVLEVVVGCIVVCCFGGSFEEGGSFEGYSFEGYSFVFGCKFVEVVEVSFEVLMLE